MSDTGRRPIERVAVIMAMRIEAEPILAALDARPIDLPAHVAAMPFRWHRARRGGIDVTVSLNGVDPTHGVDFIASQPAVLNTHVAITELAPDLVITAGTAGGWQGHGTQVGDVFVNGDRFVYHDRRIAMPAFDEYGIGSYPGVDARAMAAALGLQVGVITTGNSLDESDADRVMIERVDGRVKEMEAAAVAWAAGLHGVPVLGLKVITDLVDHHTATAEQFVANMNMARVRLTDAFVAVLDYLAGRAVGDLSGAPPSVTGDEAA